MAVYFRFSGKIPRRLLGKARSLTESGLVCKLLVLSLGLMSGIRAPFTLAAQEQGLATQQQGLADRDPTAAPVTEDSKKVPPFTIKDRLRFYEQTTFVPFAFTGPLAGAAVTQWTTVNPPEWGPGPAGYGRRVLSGYSRQVIANTIGLGVAFAAHEDPRHYPTGQHGVWKRGLYAAREAVVSRSSSGGLMPAYSRLVGVYTAGFVSNAWYPARYSNTHDALWRGSTALASDIVWQEFKEFWPDVRRKLRPRR
ncbi:MAG TPA: hypothetical protein VG860_23860 [Terriglobia bacterium]|nr:hypothetical protein [Terriglobia bacterium]